MSDIEKIKEIITKIPFVNHIYEIEEINLFINGKIKVIFEGLENPLDFTFEISPQYPLKYHDTESIKFYNSDLLQYNHVMEDGSICIHNSHCLDFEKKILLDFESLKNWIEKYYINKENDTNYEHVIVNTDLIDNKYYSYIFTDINHKFNVGDLGTVNISHIHNSIYKEEKIENLIVQSFLFDDLEKKCNWSPYYKSYKTFEKGIFYFLGEHPAKFNKFIFKNWKDFQDLVSNDFLDFLHDFDKRNLKKRKGNTIPIFIGYETINNKIHWQVAIVKIGELPIKGEPEIFLGQKTGRWKSKLIDKNIQWVLTNNSSYKCFFGRGTLSHNITNKKILIIGLGAVGSMVAKTLTRGGCKTIDIADYDVKEPENVCRSEYMFQKGFTDKVLELYHILSEISPFVEVNIIKKEYFEIVSKVYYKNKDSKKDLIDNINKYDIVFDCTTDDDLMHVLNTLELNSDIINMSITNHAQELVCAFYPNIYNFVTTLFNSILKNNLNDLYEPIGCWSPTFKASYNDINTLVQFTLRHINLLYENNSQKNNFIVQYDKENLNLQIKEF